MSALLLVQFNLNYPIRLSSDASERPTTFASRTLTAAEKDIPRLRKTFGLCQFNQYIYGRPFTLLTDHKPLTIIFNPNKGIPQFLANRLRR